MSPEGCQAAWQSSLLPFGFEHAQYTPSAQALQKLLWSSADTRACGGYLKSETQLAQEDKVLFLYLIFSAHGFKRPGLSRGKAVVLTLGCHGPSAV